MARSTFGLQKNQPAQRPSFQLGCMASPAQIVSYGFYAERANPDKSKNLSTKVYVSDQNTVENIRHMEAQAARLYPESKLNSCILNTKQLEDGKIVNLVRAKFTQEQRNFQTAYPDVVANVGDLSFGHLVVAKCRASSWSMRGECGITIYGNVLRCVGAAEKPVADDYTENMDIVWD